MNCERPLFIVLFPVITVIVFVAVLGAAIVAGAKCFWIELQVEVESMGSLWREMKRRDL